MVKKNPLIEIPDEEITSRFDVFNNIKKYLEDIGYSFDFDDWQIRGDVADDIGSLTLSIRSGEDFIQIRNRLRIMEDSSETILYTSNKEVTENLKNKAKKLRGYNFFNKKHAYLFEIGILCENISSIYPLHEDSKGPFREIYLKKNYLVKAVIDGKLNDYPINKLFPYTKHINSASIGINRNLSGVLVGRNNVPEGIFPIAGYHALDSYEGFNSLDYQIFRKKNLLDASEIIINLDRIPTGKDYAKQISCNLLE